MNALRVQVEKTVHPSLKLDVNFELGAECAVLFGASGAGKTTLLRLIAGLARPDSGHLALGSSVWFDSARRTHVPLRNRRIGMIFQDDLLFPHLNVAANIRYGLKGWPRIEADTRIDEVATLCQVEHLLARRVKTLSGGERQRVGLARALAPRPQLLLADEPVSALDLPTRNALVDRLRVVQKTESIPLLYVTHSPAEAVALGDRLFLLQNGLIAAQGPPLDVLSSAHLGRNLHLDDLRNVVRGSVEHQEPNRGETHLRLDGPNAPLLVIPHRDLPLGAPVSVSVRADDILLARQAPSGLSARNLLPGLVERLLHRDGEAEVVIRTGDALWIVSVVRSAVSSLGLEPGASVHLIIKARSCHVL